tara:strand:- start:32 stop:517 length:486 start_codon:yes stop_codon:yes gene_type:complete
LNIFYVNEDPAHAAICLPDKLVVKMPLESAQMLSTAHRVLDGDEQANSLGLYKTAMKNHPCTIWVRETSRNYMWLYYHFFSLCQEYKTRYGREHLSYTKLNENLAVLPNNIVEGTKTIMPQAMPEQYKCDDTVKAYRDYVVNEKHYAQWNKIPSRKPDWWK